MASFEALREKMYKMGFEQDGREIYPGEFNFTKDLPNDNKFVFRMTSNQQLCIYYVPQNEHTYYKNYRFMLDNQLPDSIPMGEKFIKIGIDFVKNYEKVLKELGKLD